MVDLLFSLTLAGLVLAIVGAVIVTGMVLWDRRRLLLYVAALLSVLMTSQPSYAQNGPKPPDVPAYVQQPLAYATGTAPNVLGPMNPPAYSYELADIPSSSLPLGLHVQKIKNTNATLCLLIEDGGTCQEAKFRSESRYVGTSYDDAIRNYGQPGTAHCHTLFGNPMNAWSTFASARRQGAYYSQSAGADINSTLYWFPCIILKNPFGDGKNYALIPEAIIIYYQEGYLNGKSTVRKVRGLRYVAGAHMDNNWQRVRDAMAAANAITPGRYKTFNSPTPPTLLGGATYICLATGVDNNRLRLADGTPALGDCPATSNIKMDFSGVRCWDGVNLWSPDGYDHVALQIYDTQKDEYVCPNGWYRIPALQLQIQFQQSIDNDYARWEMSCDTMYNTITGANQGIGKCFHTDWLGAWDGQVIDDWQFNCIGTHNNQPHECNSSRISPTRELEYNGVNPVSGRPKAVGVANTGTAAPNQMVLLPAGGSSYSPGSLIVG